MIWARVSSQKDCPDIRNDACIGAQSEFEHFKVSQDLDLTRVESCSCIVSWISFSLDSMQLPAWYAMPHDFPQGWQTLIACLSSCWNILLWTLMVFILAACMLHVSLCNNHNVLRLYTNGSLMCTTMWIKKKDSLTVYCRSSLLCSPGETLWNALTW